MINNLKDLGVAIDWLNRNGFKPEDVQEYRQYTHRVRYCGYTLTAGATYEWRVNAEPLATGVPLHNVLQHLFVAPWVIDQIKLAPEKEWRLE